jgi:hypothetical protein
MEVIFGVIEDILDRLEKGSADDKEDAKNELKMNFGQFQKNLADLKGKGNAEAAKLLERLEKNKP